MEDENRWEGVNQKAQVVEFDKERSINECTLFNSQIISAIWTTPSQSKISRSKTSIKLPWSWRWRALTSTSKPVSSTTARCSPLLATASMPHSQWPFRSSVCSPCCGGWRGLLPTWPASSPWRRWQCATSKTSIWRWCISSTSWHRRYFAFDSVQLIPALYLPVHRLHRPVCGFWHEIAVSGVESSLHARNRQPPGPEEKAHNFLHQVLYSNYYLDVGLFAYLTLTYFFSFYAWMVILQNLIMLPQIIHNARVGNNPGF